MHLMNHHQMSEPQILVVDGDFRGRELLVTNLGRMGFTAKAVGTAEQALRTLNQIPLKVVVVDLHLPGMGGLDLIERIRHDHDDIQVVILTAMGDLESAKRAFALDVVAFLTKPFQMGELEAALSRAFNRRRRVGATAGAAPELALVGLPLPLQQVERAHILSAMKRHQGNRRAVAHDLGISLRTLYNRLREYREGGAEGHAEHDVAVAQCG